MGQRKGLLGQVSAPKIVTHLQEYGLTIVNLIMNIQPGLQNMH
jgi:hypothetical protein